MKGSFWTGLVVGVVVGVAAGIAYGSKPGEDVRGKLVEGVREFKDAAADKGRGLLHRGRVAVDEKMDEVEAKAAKV